MTILAGILSFWLAAMGQYVPAGAVFPTAAPAAIVGPADSFVNCNTSTPGTTLTTTILNNCTQGNGNLGGWGNSGAYTGFTIQAHQTNCGLGGSVQVNAVNFPTSTTSQAIAFDQSLSVPRYISNTTATAGVNAMTIAGCYIPGIAPTSQAGDKIFDPVYIQAGSGGTYVVMQHSTGNCGGVANQYGVRLHYQDSGGGSQVAGCVQMTQNTAYWFSLHADFATGTHSLSVFDPTTGTQVGSTLTPTGSTLTATPSGAMAIRVGNNQTATDTATTYFENLLVAFSGQSAAPLGPVNSTLPPIYLLARTPATPVSATSATTPSLTIAAGTTVAVWVTNENNPTRTVSSVTDTIGNTYAIANAACTVNTATVAHGEWWIAKNATGGTGTVTANLSGSTFITLDVLQFVGASATAPYERCATGTTASGNVTSASFTPSSANDTAVMGVHNTDSSVMLPGTGYSIVNTSTTSYATEMKTSIGTSAQTATFNGGSAAKVASVLVLKQ